MLSPPTFPDLLSTSTESIKQHLQSAPSVLNEARETLAHFACVCPWFREAAHNQVRKLIEVSFLVKCLHNRRELHEETPMYSTGLRLNRVSASCMEASGRPLPENHDGTIACNLTWYSRLSHFRRLPLSK